MANMGIQTSSEYVSSTFYGLKLDVSTGNLTFDIIDDDTMKIMLPDTDYSYGVGDYREYFWSDSNVKYQWGSNGHLEVTYK
jgi:hypothetical protein